jgi:DNA-binding NtrC family response regulator
MKILLIDDDEWIRDSMTLFFESEGCRLDALETAEEGVRALSQQKYDIIISDYKLAGMDGISFFREIQKTHPDTLKMLITAYGNQDLFSETARLGIGQCVAKPFTSETIVKALTRLIEIHEQDKTRKAAADP